MDETNTQDSELEQEQKREAQKIEFFNSNHMLGIFEQMKKKTNEMSKDDYLLTDLIYDNKSGKVTAIAVYTDKSYVVFMCEKQ